jgi:hypothetical protein
LCKLPTWNQVKPCAARHAAVEQAALLLLLQCIQQQQRENKHVTVAKTA